MNKEFIVERQGRSFVLYAGLLDLAHQRGLHSIKTRLVQIPAAENGNVAIVEAVVTLAGPRPQAGATEDAFDDGLYYREFAGIGDAAPANVAPPMRHCLIRMAETRAKARALRDAVNIGVAAFEELDGEEAVEPPLPPADPKPSPPASPLAARRAALYEAWKEQYQTGPWGRAKLAQILGRPVDHFGHSFSATTEAELEAIEAFITSGKLPEVDGVPAPPAEAETPEDAALIADAPAPRDRTVEAIAR